MIETLREYRMQFERVAPGDPPVDLDALGMRSKLGGHPTWIQEDETPDCPSCEATMTFVAQIDSIEHDEDYNPHRVDALSDDQQYMFGDVGMLYVFVCLNCNVGATVVQFG